MSAPILAARGLVVTYSGRTAVDRVDLNVRHAELMALVGPNGAGKSSLLAALAGLGPHTGSVLRGGCTGAQPAPGMACVPQPLDMRTAFPLSAAQVVAPGALDARRWWRRPDAARRAAAAGAMERLDVADLAHRPFAELSGGQARPVLLARALTQGPKVLLDEPHAGLNVEAATTLNTALAAVAEAGTAVLASVHDQDLVRGAFTRTIVLDRRILADWPTTELLPAAGSLRRALSGHGRGRTDDRRVRRCAAMLRELGGLSHAGPPLLADPAQTGAKLRIGPRGGRGSWCGVPRAGAPHRHAAGGRQRFLRRRLPARRTPPCTCLRSFTAPAGKRSPCLDDSRVTFRDL